MLVDTSHPGNIGATARAMKTMGLSDLALVRPKHFPSDEATARAAGADDVLKAASVHSALTEAIADCGWVVGASARLRTVALPIVDPREASVMIWQRLAEGNQVAVLMGPEQSGLTNDDLARCQQLVHIPASPDFSSLNLAMAVQVLCYELRMAAGLRDVWRAPRFAAATHDDVESLVAHAQRTLTDIGFLDPQRPRRLMPRLRRLFGRAGLEREEVNILRGMLARIDELLGRGGR